MKRRAIETLSGTFRLSCSNISPTAFMFFLAIAVGIYLHEDIYIGMTGNTLNIFGNCTGVNHRV